LRAEPLTGGNPRRRPRTAISSQSSAAEASEWNILDSPGLTPPPRQLPRTDPLARLGCALQRALAPIFPPLASTELVRRMAVTLCMLWLIRVGHYLPIPGLDPLLTSSSGTALSFAHFLSGSREVPGNIYLLSITPYITAGFALAAFQLLPEARLHFKRLREEGRHGQERITGYLSVLFVLAALTQAIAESSRLAAAGVLAGGATGWGAKAGVAVNLMAGAVLCKWAVQTVDSWGLGDGTGVVIGAGIALSEC